MRFWRITLTVSAFLLVSVSAAAAQAPPEPYISNPSDGQAVQGIVQITGRTQINGFASAELDFAYADDTTGTWFLIATLDTPVTAGLLAEWDTSSITDATYSLRLRVTLQDGSTIEERVTRLRVRNYLPVETATPTVTPKATFSPQETPTPAPPTDTPTPAFTPTALPPNPAALTTEEIYSAMRQGALYAGALISIFGLLMRLRRK